MLVWHYGPSGNGRQRPWQIQALAHLLPICLPTLRIVCATGRAPGPFSDVVTVNVSKEGRSREQFSYVVSRPTSLTIGSFPTSLQPEPNPFPSPQLPMVHSLEPSMGPKAGGTRITIYGSDLNVGSMLQVLVNDTDPCTDLT